MLLSQNENTAKPTTPAKGTATRRAVVTFLDKAIAAPITTTIAIIDATIRNKLMSSRSFGSSTIIAAPMAAPKRDLRPPMMMPSKKSTANSLL